MPLIISSVKMFPVAFIKGCGISLKGANFPCWFKLSAKLFFLGLWSTLSRAFVLQASDITILTNLKHTEVLSTANVEHNHKQLTERELERTLISMACKRKALDNVDESP